MNGRTGDSRRAVVVLGGVLALAALIDATPQRATLAGLEGPPCALGSRLGEHACPGCGLTRATALAASGDLSTSFAVHPAGALVLALCAAGLFVHAHILVRRGRSPRHERLLRTGRIVFVAGLAAAWILRLVPGA